jgi:hypothetical protein
MGKGLSGSGLEKHCPSTFPPALRGGRSAFFRNCGFARKSGKKSFGIVTARNGKWVVSQFEIVQ